MQFIESSALGLRAARYTFTSPDSPWSVTIFPMIHIGEPGFFRSVYDGAFAHDLVLAEGVRSPVTRRVTRSYRWIGSRLGLIVQPRYPPPEAVSARIVNADLNRDEFHSEWRQVPLWLRLAVYIAAPLIGLRLRWFGSRETIAKRAALEDCLSSDEILSWDPQTAALQRSIVNARDVRLIEHLDQELSRRCPQGCRMAIVYGASHMRAVVRELRRRGFRAGKGEWHTVFDL